MVFMGCGTEEVGQKLECVRNEDCVAPKTCNVIEGVCDYVRAEPGRPDNPGELPGGSDVGTMPSDVGSTGDAGEVSDSGSGNDVFEVSDASDASEVDSGSNPPVDAGRDVEEPEPSMCEAINQSCDLSRPVQGNFVCVEGGGLGSICLERCAQADHPSTCAAGFYCREHNVNGTTVLGCAAGGCVSNRDCDHIGPQGGNCIDQGNGYRECVEGGTIPEGQACQGGAADRCMEGTKCRITNSSANTGVCSLLCNPWSSTFSTFACPGIQFCEPMTNGNGICTDHVSRPGYYNEPYDECSNVGTMCNDRARCVKFSGILSSTNYCVPFCRAGKNDCSRIYGPGLWGGQTYCDLTVFSNTNQIGYCLE